MQSCDNLQGNGAIMRQTVVSLARLSDPDLADWIDANCSFPNSMVDCIVPATGPNELALVREQGIDDIPLVVGGIIPDEDIPRLKDAGVVEIFTPGTPTTDVVAFLREECTRRRC